MLHLNSPDCLWGVGGGVEVRLIKRFSSGIIFSLNDKSSSSNLKIDALACLHIIMVTHPAHAFHAHVPALVPPVVACVGDPFYKITSEALLVTQQLVKVGARSGPR